MKINIANYTPVPDRIVVNEPVIDKNLAKGVEKTIEAMRKEKAEWFKMGKPLEVAIGYKSPDGRFCVNKGDYIIPSTEFGVISIEFEDCNRWQLPVTSIAGKITK